MKLRQCISVFISAVIIIQAPHLNAQTAQQIPEKQNSDKILETQAPREKEYPWWLEGLRSRFTFVANGLQLLQDEIDIDAAVGNNPWTLRADTLQRINFLPIKMKLALSGYIFGNIGPIVSKDDQVKIDERTSPPTQLYGTDNLSADFALSEGMSHDLLQSAVIQQIKNALSEEQMIDLAVFLLSKAPFFVKETDPNAWKKWEKIKKEIVYYDIYLILAVVVTMLMIDKVQLQVSGYLFKLNGDRFRIGWYGGIKNFGAHLNRPEFKAGLKFKAESFDSSLGFVKRMSPSDQLAIEARIVSRIFSQLLKPVGWASELAFSANHILSDKINPHNENQSFFGINTTVKNEGLRKGDSLSIAFQNSVGVDTNGHFGAGGTVILTDAIYGFNLSIYVSANKEGNANGTFINTKLGFVGSYQWDGGKKGLIYSITADAKAIRSLMSDIESLKQQPDTIQTRTNLMILRKSLSLRLPAYIQGVTVMMQMLVPEERYFPLTDPEVGYAIIEAVQEIKNEQERERTEKLMERLYFHN